MNSAPINLSQSSLNYSYGTEDSINISSKNPRPLSKLPSKEFRRIPYKSTLTRNDAAIRFQERSSVRKSRRSNLSAIGKSLAKKSKNELTFCKADISKIPPELYPFILKNLDFSSSSNFAKAAKKYNDGYILYITDSFGFGNDKYKDIYELLKSQKSKILLDDCNHPFAKLLENTLSHKIRENCNPYEAMRLLLDREMSNPKFTFKELIDIGLINIPENESDLNKIIDPELGSIIYKIMPGLLARKEKLNFEAFKDILFGTQENPQDPQNPKITQEDLIRIGLLPKNSTPGLIIPDEHGRFIYKNLATLLSQNQIPDIEIFLKIPENKVNSSIIEAYEEDNPELFGNIFNESSDTIFNTMFDSKMYTEIKDGNGWTPLHLSINSNQHSLAEKIIDTCAVDFNTQDVHGQAPIHSAIQSGNWPLVNKMIDSGKVNLNIKNIYGETPFHHIIQFGRMPTFEKMINMGAVNLNSKGKNDLTPLGFMIRSGSKDILIKMINTGRVDVNGKSGGGSTPLHIAFHSNQCEKAEILMHNDKIDINIQDDNNQTPLYMIVKNIANRNFNIKKSSLPIATKDNNVQYSSYKIEEERKVKEEKAKKIKVKSEKIEEEGILEQVERERKEREEEKSKEKVVSEARLNDIVKIIINNKNVNLNIQDVNGQTILHFALESKCYEIAEALINSGKVDLNIKDKNGQTPVQIAMQSGNFDIVKKIIDTGKVEDLNIKDNNEQSILHLAIQAGDLGMVKKMIDTDGINLNSQDKDGQTPFHLAVQGNNSNSVEIFKKMILTGRVDLNIQDKKGRTPLYLALQAGNFVMLDKLIDTKGVLFDIQDKNGQTPLHFALQHVKDFIGKTSILKKLIEAGGVNLIKIQDNNKQTPLHLAIQAGNFELFEKMIAAKGVDLNIQDKDGKAPRDIAVEYENATGDKRFHQALDKAISSAKPSHFRKIAKKVTAAFFKIG